MKFFTAIASLVACASAYQVLTPTANSTIAKGSTVDVQWSTVDTDPSTFSIYLVNFKDFPPTVLSLAQNVQQGAGSAAVRIPCSVSSDNGWQLNFINGTNTYVIYAQSQVFSLTGTCVDPTAASASPAYSNSTVEVVQTVVYQNPVVWFVQPSNLVAAAAICPPSSQQTVTVMAAPVAASTVTATITTTVSSCPSQSAIIAALAAAAQVTSAGAGTAAVASARANSTTSGTGAAGVAAVARANSTTNGTGTASAAKTSLPVVSSLPSSTSGANKIGGGAFVGLIAAFTVLLL